jgi:hypothetical protein
MTMVGVRDVEQVYDMYRSYKERVDYLHKLYAQGVPVVVPSTTSVLVQSVPSTIPDPAFPSQCLQIAPSTTSIPEEVEEEGCPS